jgi:protein-tyrosine phosphatase
VIDLHCHILHGVDDGPATLEESMSMARVAAADGIETIVATPHVSYDYPTDPGEVEGRVAELNAALTEAGVALSVVRGAEVAMTTLVELDRPALSSVAIAGGPYLLVEPPHGFVPDLLERLVFDLQVDGFRPVLAHVERCAGLGNKPDRVEQLAERGIVCSITAASATGHFGPHVRGVTRELLRRGLVHDVASDAHSAERRPPEITPARPAVEKDAAIEGAWEWLTHAVPAAIVAGEDLPAVPAERPVSRGPGAIWRRLRQASGGG